jgi:hypothetical protein
MLDNTQLLRGDLKHCGKETNNGPVTAGIYFYKMRAWEFVKVSKLVLVR